MDCKINTYNLNQNENIFYIFEIKVKDIEGVKHTIRRIKQKKEDNLINLTDEINKINYFKVIVFDVNDPTNIITLKKYKQ